MENIVIYDWVSITSKIHSISDFIELLGLHDISWQTLRGSHGFQHRQYYNCISIHYERDDGYVWLDMSGQGCRAFESYGTGDYESLFRFVRDHEGDVKLTRLDVAYDDHVGVLDIDRIFNDCLCENYVSKLTSWDAHKSDKGTSIIHGSSQSEFLIRIYDKAAERKCDKGKHWIRVEMQMRRDRAFRFVEHEGTIGEKFAGVLVNYLRYIQPNDFDSNKWRWEIADYWANLLGDAVRISIFNKPGVDYNVLHLENFVIRQAGNAIDTMIKLYGVDVFLEKLNDRDTLPNLKYKMLIEEHKKFLEENKNDPEGVCHDQ